MQFRPMTKAEQKYCFAQSLDLNVRTGLVGYLRGDFGRTGRALFTTFFDVNTNLKTPIFRAQFDAAINSLRTAQAYGPILCNLEAMVAYCSAHPEGKLIGEDRQYGYRADFNGYVFLVRANPAKGDCNFYVYCYVQEYFDRHLAVASKGIRFVRPNYETLFYLTDGEQVSITSKDGKRQYVRCRYISDSHFQFGGLYSSKIYHIFEFAELMARNGSSVEPVTDVEGA